MNFSNYRFTLDIQKAQAQISIPVRYRDTGHCLYITLSDGGQPYRIGEGCRAVFYAKKPNGSPLINDCYIEDEGTVVRYDFNAYTANVAGVHYCEVRIIDEMERVITSPSFIMVVDERVVFDDDIITDEDRDTLLALDVIASEADRRSAEFAREENEQLRSVAEDEREGAEIARVTAENARVSAETARDQKLANFDSRITGVERYLGGENFVIDETTAYEKKVPSNACEKAKILSIGGMTYKDKEGKRLVHAKVTSLLSEGANLLNLIGWSAEADAVVLSNAFGTTISSLEGNSITVSQSNYPITGDPATYENGFFMFFPDKHLVNGKDYRISFDLKITNNPLDVSYVHIVPNDYWSGETRIDISKTNAVQRCSGIITYNINPSFPNNCYVECRNCGVSFEIGNVMITEADVELPYTPYVGVIDYLRVPESFQNGSTWGVGTADAYNKIYFVEGKAFYSAPAKSYEFTGDEDLGEYGSTEDFFRCVSNALDDAMHYPNAPLCSHLDYGEHANTFFISSGMSRLSFRLSYDFFRNGESTNTERIEAVRNWLRNEKTNGTPVTVVYPLENPPADTNISPIMSRGNIIQVAKNGYIVADNNAEKPVPFGIKYLVTYQREDA